MPNRKILVTKLERYFTKGLQSHSTFRYNFRTQ